MIPRVMGHVTGLSPLLVLVSVSAIGLLFGGFYVLLATPLTAVLVDAARRDRARQGPGRGRRAGRAVRERVERLSLGLAPAAEDQAAEREAEPEGADREGADRDRLAPRRETLPSGRAPPAPRSSAARRAAACAARRPPSTRGRGRRRSRSTHRAFHSVYSVGSALPVRLLHISDLHAGSVEETGRRAAASSRSWSGFSPNLIAVTGDLTHRGRRPEHEHAAAFLRGLGRPLLVIPGNHDIPYTFPARFTRPWAEFERQWETVEPVFRSDEPARRRASTRCGPGGTSRAGSAARRSPARPSCWPTRPRARCAWSRSTTT